MSIKVFNNLDSVSADYWNNSIEDNNLFVRYDFLKYYSDNHKEIEHIYVVSENERLYGHVFNINLSDISNYTRYAFFKYIFDFFVRFIKLRFFYFTNSFLTNIPAFSIKRPFDLKNILSTLNKNIKSDFIVIPDFLFDNINNKSDLEGFVKVEVEEEMILNISNSWIDFNSYIASLKTKYRRRVDNISKRSIELDIKLLELEDIELHKDSIQKLFNNVTDNANFKGPVFNVNALFDLTANLADFRLYGYFMDNKLLAFSSEFTHLHTLYSYFVGIDYNYNKQYSLYERILCETINHAILFKKDNLVFGRTANEFKSNFGAVPQQSFIYILVRNKLLRMVLRKILINIKPKAWIQRFPFKTIT
tara:strand:+ start:3122 stop:4207 length:1086 start_codon:yes stop_codon:yes gene_type:complete